MNDKKDMEYEKAASATYTVLMHNIDNSLQMSNMQFYMKEQKVDVSKVKDLEEQVSVVIYLGSCTNKVFRRMSLCNL